MNMTPEIKAKWIEALRSGKYKQGQYYLHGVAANTYCCLGVLGVVCGKPNGDLDDNKSGMTPKSWGLLSEAVVDHLINMNDQAVNNFAQIADFVEANL